MVSDLRVPEFAEVEPVFAPHSTVAMEIVPAGLVNIFSQQRLGRNEQQDKLTRSIAAEGIINPLNVTILEEHEVFDYLQFTNRIWQSDVDFNDFTPMEDGRFLTLIAGHSRLISALEIATRRGLPIIGPNAAGLPCQIHKVDGVDGYVGLQVAENIHSAPPKSRAARAYAEAFLWAKEQDPDLSKTSFARNHGLGKTALNGALLYSELPPSVRDRTDEGILPFSVSVQLSRALKAFRLEAERSASTIYAEGSFEHQKYSEELVNLELERYISLFNGEYNRHITNITYRIKSDVRGIMKRHEEALAAENSEEENLQMALIDARDTAPPTTPLQLEAKIETNLKHFVSRHNGMAFELHKTVVELTRLGYTPEEARSRVQSMLDELVPVADL